MHVDATLIVQLLANLLENAAKYTPAGSRISISARADEGMLTVIVEDDGPGLPAGDPDRLFDKFQRGRSESEVDGRRTRVSRSAAPSRARTAATSGQRTAPRAAHGSR